MNSASEPEFEIDKLSREHDLTQFDCGNATLNSWLVKYAWLSSSSSWNGSTGDRIAFRRLYIRYGYNRRLCSCCTTGRFAPQG